MMRRFMAVFAPLLLTMVMATAPAAHASPVSPYTARPMGHSYPDWLRMVGQYYLGDASNPLFAGLGGDCGQVRDGVFWMAAPIDVNLEFDCDVPVGTWVVLSPAAYFSTEGIDGTTDAELQAAVVKGFAPSTDWLTLDGRDVPLKTLDTGAFDVVSEPGSFYDAILGVGTGPVRSALRGNVVVIHPLTPGDHTIESAVSFVGDGAFSATYHIHVG
jgi:hypothetical protein